MLPAVALTAAKHAGMAPHPTSVHVVAAASSTKPFVLPADGQRRFLLSHVKTARSIAAIASRNSVPRVLLAAAAATAAAVAVAVVVAAAVAGVADAAASGATGTITGIAGKSLAAYNSMIEAALPSLFFFPSKMATGILRC